MFLWARFHGAKRIFLKDMGGIFGKAVDFTKPVRGLGMKGGEVMGECRDRKAPLKWGMVTLLVLCWLLPLAVIAYVMLYVAAGKINSQTERTIVTSVDNAVRICEMRMDAAVEASRNASYLPTIDRKSVV